MMRIPILRLKYLNNGRDLRFQLLDHLTVQPLFDGKWFSEGEVEEKSLEYTREAVRMSIAQAKAEFVDGNRPLRRR